LIFSYLQGELTSRFLLKIAAVLLISAAVFGYYLWELRREKSAKIALVVKIAKWALMVVVAGLVVFGFYSAGSPQTARALKLDQQRIGDLQGMQSQILYFWQQKNRLPVNSAELRDSISGYVAPQDPETGNAYEYTILGDLKFELCADFKTEGEIGNTQITSEVLKPMSYPSYFDNWQHGTGRTCFERTIDSQLYKLNQPAAIK
jgi:radical SAM superfamily enzyme with C-terminal helix-hairpin-helix motif